MFLIKVFKATPDEIAVYKLPRAYGYGLNYYFGTELPQWTPENTRANYLFLSEDSQPPLNQSPKFIHPRAGSFAPATSDGKIYLLLGQQSGK